MKYLIFLFAVISSALIISMPMSHAQVLDHSYFSVEGTAYLDIIHGTPNAELEFYSNNNGGQCILTRAMDPSGKKRIELKSNKYLPAFVLDKSTHFISWTRDSEFSLSHALVDKTTVGNKIEFQIDVSESEEVEIKLMRSADAEEFHEIHAFNPTGTEMELYIDEEHEGSLVYRLDIYSTKRGLRYQYVLPMIMESKLTVYPSPAKETIRVNVPSSYVGSMYQLIDISGRIHLSGRCQSLVNEVKITDLAPGLYCIKLLDTPWTSIFVKQ